MVVMTQLLATKLVIPRVRSSFVARPHLLERVNDGLQRKLTLISALPGAGKTMLLGEWWSVQAKRDFPIGWVSLDDGDNDATRFWSYCIKAIEKCVPDVGQEALSLLHTFPSPPIESVLTTVINVVATAAQEDFALVLDDYHLIQTEAIHQAVHFLLDHLPASMHVVLITRTDPPIPLARLRATDELMEIRTADLRFSPAEACMYFNQTMSLNLSLENATQLVERTDGWVAGLQLAALALRECDDVGAFIHRFSGNQRYILEYLMQEVLQKQPEYIQKFLLDTSIVHFLTEDLCNALTRRADGQSILQWLDQNNLFVVSLDQEQRWYRYHALFRDFILSMFEKARTEADKNDMHKRAACWYESHQMMNEAIYHRLASGDEEKAANAIELVARTLWMRGEALTLQQWLQSLSSTVLQEHMQLGLFYAWSLIAAGKTKEAQQQVDRVMSVFSQKMEKADHTLLWAEINILQATLARFRGDAARTIVLSQQVATYLPQDDFVLQSINMLNLGHGYRLHGNNEQASAAFSRSVTLGNIVGNLYTVFLALNNLIVLKIEHGTLHVALDYCQESRQRADRHRYQRLPILGHTHIKEGELMYEWNRFEDATYCLEQGMKLAQQDGIRILSQGHMAQARLLQARGEVVAANEILSQAYSIARERASTVSIRLIAALQARLWLMQGSLARAITWGENCGLTMKDVPDYAHEYEYLTLARLYIAQGKANETVTLLERLRQEAHNNARNGTLIEILLLQAFANDAQQQSVEAYVALERALELALPERYVRLFIDEGVLFAQLLTRFVAWRKSTSMHLVHENNLEQYVQFLLHLSMQYSAISPATSIPLRRDEAANAPLPVVEAFGEREQEVIRYLAAGLSNQAIADAMVIALSTVKSHLKNIYRKLDVESRTQAVARARELHLL